MLATVVATTAMLSSNSCKSTSF